MKITVLYRQSIPDVALQHTGSVENCFAVALANGFSVSDPLTAGMTVEIPDDILKNTDVLNYYSAKKIRPATELSLEDISLITPNEGLGYWTLGLDFILQ